MRIAICLQVTGFLLASAVVSTNADESSYRGQTIQLIVATSAGGDYDTRARLLARHMGENIPGRPNIVVKNMPGAGGLRATNYIFNSAPRDGTVLLASEQQAPLIQALGTPGVEYDIRKGAYIGNTSSSPIVLVSWHTSPVKTFEDALKTELVLGASGGASASSRIPAMLSSVLGAKFKTVAGYPGGNEIYLAMEKGEVFGRATQNWAGWKAQKPDWIAQGKVNLLAQGGQKKHPELPSIPLLRDFAKTEEDKQLIDFFLVPDEIARSIMVGPDVPLSRVDILRRAFEKTLADPKFIQEADKLRLDITGMSGEDVERIAGQLLDASASVKERARAFSSYK